MQFRVFRINQERGYTFLVGTHSPPTSKLREQIGEVLAGAWSGLFEGGKRNTASYGFELVFDKTPPTGETELFNRPWGNRRPSPESYGRLNIPSRG